jgi:hypothetical protein
MAREHPSVPKASSSKAPLAFDDETDEDEANMRKKNKVASAKKKQSKVRKVSSSEALAL